MASLGTEKVLNLSTIKRHYDALGSYLHIPTLKQVEKSGAVDFDNLRKRCDQICTEVEATLQAPVWNINFGTFVTIPCMQCNHPVRKRIDGSSGEIARCFECGVTYEVKEVSPGNVSWKRLQTSVLCQALGCGKSFFLDEADIEAGKSVACIHCAALHDIDLVIRLRDATAISDAV
jgi:hypothetical protein